MIRYYCDICHRPLDPDEDLRYVVKMEVYAAFDPSPQYDSSDEGTTCKISKRFSKNSNRPTAMISARMSTAS